CRYSLVVKRYESNEASLSVGGGSLGDGTTHMNRRVDCSSPINPRNTGIVGSRLALRATRAHTSRQSLPSSCKCSFIARAHFFSCWLGFVPMCASAFRSESDRDVGDS